MIRLGIWPSGIARRAFEREVKVREELQMLARVKGMDPRITLEDLRKKSKIIRRMLGE
jgi:hypothetical protein